MWSIPSFPQLDGSTAPVEVSGKTGRLEKRALWLEILLTGRLSVRRKWDFWNEKGSRSSNQLLTASTLVNCSDRESNPEPELRRPLFYPLNYRNKNVWLSAYLLGFTHFRKPTERLLFHQIFLLTPAACSKMLQYLTASRKKKICNIGSSNSDSFSEGFMSTWGLGGSCFIH